jgi:S-methylmethionine-dependent homocysteine/selenocysteine methylase
MTRSKTNSNNNSSKSVTILDGGMGRELKRIGAPFSQPLWSAEALIESPAHVTQAHQNFVKAGAQIVITNSYACVPFHLGQEVYDMDGARLARESAQLAQKVALEATSKVLVAGSIPPAMGSYRPDLFDPEKAKQIQSTLFKSMNPLVDLWIAETISSLEEYEIVRSIFKDAPEKSCYYSFTLKDDQTEQDISEHGAQLRSGDSVKDVAERLCQTNATGMLFNCSMPEFVERAIAEAKQVFDSYQMGNSIVLGAYANTFTKIKLDHEANSVLLDMREISPEQYVEFAKKWHTVGATIIGGCCGIGPEHIEALCQWKDTL